MTFRCGFDRQNIFDPHVSSKDVALNHIGVGEYWQLNKTAGPSTGAFVKLSWDSYSGTVDNMTQLRVTGWNGTT